ncbi:mitochondrial proton/calcium exchanger protein-like protein isoform X1 [Tanacetum coccineum]|uniref:Mitochondrial proton/calcium exchanger protein-like protein isoform X1 n=1 Tax=Tanacetum coccineum TaxID=301880 RepID=A0ABQ5B4S8_9ASTR
MDCMKCVWWIKFCMGLCGGFECREIVASYGRSSKKHFKSLSLDELRSPDFNLLSDKNYSEEEEEEEEMAEYSQKWHNGTSRGRSGGYRATAPGYYQRNNANPSFQERRQSMEDTLSKFMSESAKRHEENSNLIKEIRASTDAAIRNQGASIKTLEIQIRQMSKVLQERGFGSLPSSTETNPRDQVKSISTTVEAYSNSIHSIGSNQYAVSSGQNSTLLYKSRQMTVPFLSRLDNHYCEEEGNYGPKFTKAYGASHINNAIPQKEKDPGSFTLPCFINDFCFDNALVDLGASVSVMPLSTYLNLGLGELAHTRLTVELADRTVKYPKGIAENDVKVPLILGRPFLSTAHAKIDVYKRKITLRFERKNGVDLEARLMGETLVLNRSLDPFSEDYIELNDLNEPFELRRNQGDNLMPTIEEVLEDMDAYRDNEMGDIIFSEPFLREVGIKTKRFKGIITLYNGDNEVTYQIVQSHPKFKRQTNEQCNKIPPLLKVSENDKINIILHAYQKLKGFYKGVLNLGPDFIRVPSMEEWLTRGHISVHELE